MTIWLLAVLLLASVAGLGYRQGAVRVGISFLAIVVGALLAVPLGGLVGKLLGVFGLKDPLLLWALGPIIVFILISAGFKVGAAAVHQKIDVHYRYHAGDLKFALWERLNHRLGLCLGVLNGVAYLILLSFLIYVPSYATVQFASSDGDPKWMRLLNTLGTDLHTTGLDKVAKAVDRVPQADYNMVDFAALLYRNPLVEARLSSYPAFLSLAERGEFTALGNDKQFTDFWQRQVPVTQFLDCGAVQMIRSSPDLLKLTWGTVQPDLADVKVYLATGHSPKYDPIQILGRWKFDVNAAVSAMRRAKPTIASSEMQKIKAGMRAAFAKTRMVARPDKQITIRDIPNLRGGATGGGTLQTLQGQWNDLEANKYQLSVSGATLPATIQGDRLTVKAEGMDLVFNRED